MATTKTKSSTKTTNKKDGGSKLKLKDVEEFLIDKNQCNNCGRILEISKNFYVSYSKVNKHNQRMSICKDCLNSLIVEYIDECQDIKVGIYKACRITGVYFTEEQFNYAYRSVGYNPNLGLIENGLEIWKVYIKNTNSLKQNSGKSFDEGQQLNLDKKEETEVNADDIDELTLEKELEFQRNKADIIKILGYYPFEGEDNQDLLCGQLITFLGDEDIKDDAIKLNAIISIIRTQRAVDVLSKSLSEKTRDLSKLDDQLGSIKQMSQIQKDLSKTILDTAKDNKLTDLWSGKKTAGTNSLTGTLYKLRQIGLDDVQVNLFDIRTSLGMEQVAKQSAKAIVENLNWGDDASMDMIKDQRVLVNEYYRLYTSLKEENRKLKVICNLNGVDYKKNNFIKEVEWQELKPIEELTRDDVDAFVNMTNKRIEEIENMEKQIEQITVLEYCEKVIEENNEKEKQKILDNLTNK